MEQQRHGHNLRSDPAPLSALNIDKRGGSVGRGRANSTAAAHSLVGGIGSTQVVRPETSGRQPDVTHSGPMGNVPRGFTQSQIIVKQQQQMQQMQTMMLAMQQQMATLQKTITTLADKSHPEPLITGPEVVTASSRSNGEAVLEGAQQNSKSDGRTAGTNTSGSHSPPQEKASTNTKQTPTAMAPEQLTRERVRAHGANVEGVPRAKPKGRDRKRQARKASGAHHDKPRSKGKAKRRHSDPFHGRGSTQVSIAVEVSAEDGCGQEIASGVDGVRVRADFHGCIPEESAPKGVEGRSSGVAGGGCR